MQLQFIPVDSTTRPPVEALYLRAFPADERIPFDILLRRAQFNDVQCLDIRDEKQHIGMLFLMRHKDLILILYFAIEDGLRSQGFGSAVLQKVIKEHVGCRLFVDIEALDKAVPDYENRVRRRNFYLRHGFASTNRGYSYKSITYEILSYGGNVTRDECRSLIRAFQAKMPPRQSG